MKGYTELFKKIVEACGDKLEIKLETDYRELADTVSWGHMIYTGPVDQYFNCCYGELPYRSLRFEHESYGPAELEERLAISGKPGFWQPAMQVNYPNENDFTRIVEVKHATGQQCESTTIVKEYPEDFVDGMEPYYPVPTTKSSELYKRYKELAEAEPGVSFVGRLATYRYYNMDQVVGMALAKFDQLKKKGSCE